MAKSSLLIVLTISVLAAAGCARYERRPLAFRPPHAYENYQALDGVAAGAEKFDDQRQARQAFGFDILKAEVLPVQLVLENGAAEGVRIVPEQSYLVMPDGRMWSLLREDVARERISEATGWGEIAPGAGRGAVLGGAAGTVIGAAVGVLTGRNVLQSAGKGAVAGAAGGAVVGGAEGVGDPEVNRAIARDLREASLQNKTIAAGELGHGVLFFPAEARGADGLRVRIEYAESGRTRDITLPL